MSTEAKIGKILILIGIIIQIIGIAAVLSFGSGMLGWLGYMMSYSCEMMGWGVFGGVLGGGLFLILIKIVGLIAGIYAYKSVDKGEFHNAGILAIVSSVIPPLQLIMLVGGILCFVSREAKK